jgi:D-alanyl-D-alanine carboxypeptidase/D-alanyl-D-alanine-endopeptidase (penicillin-binding protein 4)
MLKPYFKVNYFMSLMIVLIGLQIPYDNALANANKKLDRACLSEVKSEIDEIVTREEFKRSRWGILIQFLDSGETLYSLDAEKYFIVASNVKLLTTAAALVELRSQFRLRTSAYVTGEVPHLKTLRVVGKSDPSFTTKQLQSLAQQLKRNGVRTISQVIVEDSYFKQSSINASWEWEDIFFAYATSINSLILNKNSVALTLFPQRQNLPVRLSWSDAIAARQWQLDNQTRTTSQNNESSLEVRGNLGNSSLNLRGEIAIDAEPETLDLSIPEPDRYFLKSFLKVLAEEGIRVKKGMISQVSNSLVKEREIAFVESESLGRLIKETNQESNNLYAEALLQILGSESGDRDGIEAVKKILTRLGVNPNSYVLVDGSGLSRHNLVSPEAIIETLRLMAKHPEAKAYQDSLTVAGVNGSLEERFQNTLLEGNLRGKTGTLSGNLALSGYLNLPKVEPLVFSITVNQSDRSVAELRETIDEIAIALSQIESCSSFEGRR